VINYPNEEISITNPNAIGYNDYAVSLSSRNYYSLPNMIDVPLGLTDVDFDFCITNCGDVQFHNLSCGNTFSWDFGDINTSTLESPSHTYSGPGTYPVTFTVITNLANGGTSSSTVTKTITINIPATPSIVGPQIVNCPTPVNQFAQYSSTPLDPNLDYYWTPTGGTLVGSNPTDVAYIDWSSPSSLKVIAIDPSTGCTDSTSIDVFCASDSCGITANYTTSINSCNVTFTNTSTITVPFVVSSYAWNFGDVNTSTVASPTHIYNANGTYTVRLIVTGIDPITNTGCTDTVISTVTVSCIQTSPCSNNCNIENLVVDGDFEIGNAFLTSLNTSCTCALSSYCIDSEPRDKCTNASWIDNLWDHTFGTAAGNFMIIDGPTSYPSGIWSQRWINVVAGQTYEFSFWNIREISDKIGNNSTQIFDMTINGTVVNTVDNSLYPSNRWVKYCVAWTATNTGSISLGISQTAGNGNNNYGIDDIEFGTCTDPEPCIIEPNFKFNSDDGCTYIFNSTSFVNTGVNITSYQWTINGVIVSTSQNLIYNFQNSGIYSICLTVHAENGTQTCDAQLCKEIKVKKDCKPVKGKLGANLIAWPNPSNGLYYLNVNAEYFNSATIKVYNVMGHEVSFRSDIQEGLAFVELDENETGIYFVTLQKGSQLMKTTLIKY